MNIAAFFKAVEAEVVGGRVKAVIDGVHHFIADLVDGNPVLTAAGVAAREALESQAPAIVSEITNAPAAVAEVSQILSDPAGLAGGAAASGVGGVAEALAKPVAEKAAVEGVDAVLDAIAGKTTKKTAAAKTAA